jgi:glycogen synthase
VAAVGRAVDAFRQPASWKDLILAGMTADHSWGASAAKYADLYEAAVAERAARARLAA